eukprot:Gb_40557 [translate_table: standard]
MTVRSLIWISLTSPLPTTSSTKITGHIKYNLMYPNIQLAHDLKAIQHGAGREMKGPIGGPSLAWSKEIGCYDRITVPSAMMFASFHSMKGSERQVQILLGEIHFIQGIALTSHQFSQEATILVSKHINDEERIVATNTLPKPGDDEEELQETEFHSFAFAIPIIIPLPPRGKGPSLLGLFVGEEGFEPPTPWFIATCSNPLSYRPRFHWICSQESLLEGTFPLLSHSRDTPLVSLLGREPSSALPFHPLSCRNKVQITRSVRMPQLHTSLHFYLTPIVMINDSSHRDLILDSQYFCRSIPCKDREPIIISTVFTTRGSQGSKNRRALILGWASYLDAFSSYSIYTWLPSVYHGHDNWPGHCDLLCEEAPLLLKLRGYFVEFLRESYLVPLGILYLPTCVNFGYRYLFVEGHSIFSWEYDMGYFSAVAPGTRTLARGIFPIPSYPEKAKVTLRP